MKEPPGLEELEELAALGVMDVKSLLNPRSKVLRESGLDPEKISPRETAELVGRNPRVLYRPLLTDGTDLVLGFHPEKMEKLLQP